MSSKMIDTQGLQNHDVKRDKDNRGSPRGRRMMRCTGRMAEGGVDAEIAKTWPYSMLRSLRRGGREYGGFPVLAVERTKTQTRGGGEKEGGGRKKKLVRRTSSLE